MKRLLIGLLALGSISAFAKGNCEISSNLPDASNRGLITSILEQKGYTVSNSKENLFLRVEVNKNEIHTLPKVFVIAKISGDVNQLTVTKYKKINILRQMNKATFASSLEFQDYDSESRVENGLKKAARLKKEVESEILKKIDNGIIAAVSKLPSCNRFLDLSI